MTRIEKKRKEKKKKIQERIEDFFDVFDLVEALYWIGRVGKRVLSFLFKAID